LARDLRPSKPAKMCDQYLRNLPKRKSGKLGQGMSHLGFRVERAGYGSTVPIGGIGTIGEAVGWMHGGVRSLHCWRLYRDTLC
jgi:hypothetical protein